MKRSFNKNLFVIILVLISLTASGIKVMPAHAVGGSVKVVPLTLPDGLSASYLNGIWGSSSSDVYVVGTGSNGSDDLPLLYRWNGTSWSGSSQSLPSNWYSGLLTGIWGSSTSNVYAIGYGINESFFTRPLVYNWNGSSWAASSPDLPGGWDDGRLFGVWGSGASNVYTVGYGFSGSSQALPLVSHWNGSSWAASSPALPGGWSDSRLFGVWGSSANDIYAVGDGFDGSTTSPLISHWNGSSWAASSPALPGGWTTGNLRGVWGSSSSDVYVVGTGSNGSANLPLLYHWNGSIWAASSLTLPTGWNSGYLAGVWGSSDSDIYVAGNGSNGSLDLPMLYHWNGVNWSEASPSMPTGWSSDYLNSVWGSSASDIFIAGYGNNGSANMQLLYRSSQTGQDVAAPGNVTNLTAAPGTPDGSVNLRWIAPADDAGNNGSGSVASYLVKYSSSPFTSWSSGTRVITGLPTPTVPGTAQTMTVSAVAPGALYYFAVRAQDEQYNLSANYVVASARAKAPPSTGTGIYDDTDAAWSYTGNWATVTATGPYNSTDRYSNDPTATASFTFSGTGFAFKYLAYSNRGNIQVWVDGEQVDTIHATSATVAWQSVYVRSGLSADITHTVVFKHGGPAGSYIDIDAIQILAPAEAGIYDNTNPLWSYTGNWTVVTTPGPYNSTDRYSNDPTATASITFNGTGFAFKYLAYSNRGNIQVWVDGEQVDTIHATSATLGWQSVYVKDGLSADITHTVIFKHGGPAGSYIDIDAIQILAPAEAGTYDDTDPTWSYTGNWATVTATGPYNSTDRYSNDPTATASFKFNGTGFAFKYLAYSNRGNIQVWVDGEQVDTINANRPTLAWQSLYVKDGLSADITHTVVFKHGGPAGSYIDIDAIQILAPAEVGTYDDTDPTWSYTGNWTVVTTPGPYNSTDRYSNDPTATASFKFNGTSFAFKYLAYSNRGNIQVWVDGEQVDTIHATNATLLWQSLYIKDGLSADITHTVVFKQGGPAGSYIDIDAIQILAPAEVGIYDDTDPTWVYTGNWTVATTTGPYNSTDRYSNDPTATATFIFNGTGFAFKYLAYSNRGNIQVWVDGEQVDTIHATNATLVWQSVYVRSGLSADTTHTVVFKQGGPAGSYIDIDAIQILAPAEAGTYDDPDPAWSYTGNWAAVTTTGPYNSTDRYSNEPTATASITFNGTGFAFKYLAYSNRGNIQVWVDGEQVDTIDANSPTLDWQSMYTMEGLSADITHTVIFKHGGPAGSYIDIDSIDILP